MGSAILQSLARDALRERVMSVWMLVRLGLSPLGSLQLGGIATAMSPALGPAASAIATLAGAALVVRRERALLLPVPERERPSIVAPVPFVVARAS